MEKMPITKAGFEKLKKELDQLKRVLIPENIKAIEEARGHGDISENAEFQCAKERQSFLHGRMQEVENSLATSQIVELNGLTGDRVVFGTTVSIADIGTGDTTRYQLSRPLRIRRIEQSHFRHVPHRQGPHRQDVGDISPRQDAGRRPGGRDRGHRCRRTGGRIAKSFLMTQKERA